MNVYREQIFADRAEAGCALARLCKASLAPEVDGGQTALVLAVSTGGVPLAKAVAWTLEAELDVMIPCRIVLPDDPGHGIGAVTADGPPLLTATETAHRGMDARQVTAAVEAARKQAAKRTCRLRGDRPPPWLAGRTVIVVDDGLAVGVMARAVLRAIRSRQPAKLIFAAPVCSLPTVTTLRRHADEVIFLRQPPRFVPAGQWYVRLTQLSDEQAADMLAYREGHPAGPTIR